MNTSLFDIVNGKHTILHNGEVIAISKDDFRHHGIVGESFYDGSAMFTRNLKNNLLLLGRTFILEKENNIRSTFTPTPIDQDLGVSTAGEIDRSLTNLKEESIIGFVVGVGGCGDSRNSVAPVYSHHKNVPGQIPFRVIDTSSLPDLTGAERDQYFLRKVVGNYVYYYGKKVTSKSIKTEFENGVEVPADVHNQASPGEILNYVEYQLDVSSKDIREYFMLTEGSTINSRFNTIGLVTGYPVTLGDGKIEYRNVRCNTTLNMDNRDLKDAISSAVYKYKYLIK